jgi:methylglutaconyl-CoA hydratase
MQRFVESHVESGVVRLTLNRPDKRNALSRQVIDEIRGHLDATHTDSSLRLLVLQASGTVFCAGMDLAEMQQRAGSARAAEEWLEDARVYCEMLIRLYTLPLPAVAVVQGPVLAGGMGLVLACDIVLASETAFFSLPEPARGITAAMVTPLLVHRVGSGIASYLLLSGERCPATSAWRMGLCHDVVPAAELAKRSDRLIAAVLAGAPSALAITKQHIHECAEGDLVERLRQSIEASSRARETDDAAEGLRAFLEKRKPRWQL